MLGFVAYNVSQPPSNHAPSINTQKNAINTLKNAVPNDAVMAEEVTVNVSHFLARLNGNKIGIYVYDNSAEPKETFLYNIDVHLNELTPTDVEHLKTGVILPTKESLASFEEDFSG